MRSGRTTLRHSHIGDSGDYPNAANNALAGSALLCARHNGSSGQHSPVVCLRKLFGIPEKTEDKRTRIVVVQHGTASLGIIVDHVSSVLTFEQIQTTEGSLNRQQSSLIAIGKHADGLFGIISMDKVMESLYA